MSLAAVVFRVTLRPLDSTSCPSGVPRPCAHIAHITCQARSLCVLLIGGQEVDGRTVESPAGRSARGGRVVGRERYGVAERRAGVQGKIVTTVGDRETMGDVAAVDRLVGEARRMSGPGSVDLGGPQGSRAGVVRALFSVCWPRQPGSGIRGAQSLGIVRSTLETQRGEAIDPQRSTPSSDHCFRLCCGQGSVCGRLNSVEQVAQRANLRRGRGHRLTVIGGGMTVRIANAA